MKHIVYECIATAVCFSFYISNVEDVNRTAYVPYICAHSMVPCVCVCVHYKAAMRHILIKFCSNLLVPIILFVSETVILHCSCLLLRVYFYFVTEQNKANCNNNPMLTT